MEQLAMLALWPVIGVIVWWASGPLDRQRRWWLIACLVVGPFMLVVLAWHFIVSAERARPRSQ